MIVYECHQCRTPMESPDGMAFSREKCPACGTLVIVPGAVDPTEADADRAASTLADKLAAVERSTVSEPVRPSEAFGPLFRSSADVHATFQWLFFIVGGIACVVGLSAESARAAVNGFAVCGVSLTLALFFAVCRYANAILHEMRNGKRP